MTASTLTQVAPKASFPYQVIALDLDGTLLNNDHRLSRRTIQGLRALHHQGLRIIFCTGRAISTVYEHIQALDLPQLYVVCSNGAAAFDCRLQDGKVEAQPLFVHTVPAAVARATIELAMQHNQVTQYYVNDEIYAHPVTDEQYALTAEYRRLTGSQTIYVTPKDNDSTNNTQQWMDDLLARGYPTKQLVLFPAQDQDETMQRFAAKLASPELLQDGQPATLVRGSLGWFLEVLPAGVHKGAGLLRLCKEHLNTPISRVVAFGDGDNDIEFLQMAGWAVVMKNGRQVVKDLADQITQYTNDEDGVIRTLHDLQAQGWLDTNQALSPLVAAQE